MSGARTWRARLIATLVAEPIRLPARVSRAQTWRARLRPRLIVEPTRRPARASGPDTATEAQTEVDRQADTGAGQRTTLIEPERAESYNSRWNELKSEFVDDPRRAVQGANVLVGEVLDELEELFRSQRADLEHGLDSDQTSTEDLRQALGRYRSFFDRLLTF